MSVDQLQQQQEMSSAVASDLSGVDGSTHQHPLPTTMQALVKRQPGESYSLETVEVRSPKEDEVLICVDAVALCGSDIELYKWTEAAKVIATIPFIPGHECTGTVVAAGRRAFTAPNGSLADSVTGTSAASPPIQLRDFGDDGINGDARGSQLLQPGQRVAVENHFYCGRCALCLEGRGDICLSMGQFGVGKQTDQGGCAQYAVVPARYCFPITTDISVDEAALLEPLGVAHNAMEQLEVRGQDVLILGSGPIGLLACSVAKALGAKRVLVADMNADRLRLAPLMKADVLIDTKTTNLKQVIWNETEGIGISRICEMSGAESMINGLFSLLRKNGQVVLVGLPKTPLHVENVATDILFKSLTVRSIHGRRIYRTWRECERLLAEQVVDVKPIISHHIPLTRYEEAFGALIDGTACKIIIDPQQ
jgi:2-desacetyl-2-hydroxyethyl bacteriochlorophyllide A dehydrogenase